MGIAQLNDNVAKLTPAQKAAETRRRKKYEADKVNAARVREAMTQLLGHRICTADKFQCSCCGRQYPAGMAIALHGVWERYWGCEGLTDDCALDQAFWGNPTDADIAEAVAKVPLVPKMPICPICYHTIVAPVIDRDYAFREAAWQLINEFRAAGGKEPIDEDFLYAEDEDSPCDEIDADNAEQPAKQPAEA